MCDVVLAATQNSKLSYEGHEEKKKKKMMMIIAICCEFSTRFIAHTVEF